LYFRILDPVHVVVEAEDASCEQECLAYVEQQAVGHIVDLYDLIGFARLLPEGRKNKVKH